MIDNEKKKRLLKCSLCVYTKALKSDIILHFKEYHGIEIEKQELHFSSESEFKSWKVDLEKKVILYMSYMGHHTQLRKAV